MSFSLGHAGVKGLGDLFCVCHNREAGTYTVWLTATEDGPSVLRANWPELQTGATAEAAVQRCRDRGWGVTRNWIDVVAMADAAKTRRAA